MIDRMAKIGFTFFLLALTALLFYLTLDLGRIARLVPLWVVIPTLGLLLQQVERHEEAAERADDDRLAVADAARESRRQFTRDVEAMQRRVVEVWQQADRDLAEAARRVAELEENYRQTLRELNALRARLEASKQPGRLIPHGTVRWVNYRLRAAWIDLGSADALARHTEFDVYPAELIRPASAGAARERAFVVCLLGISQRLRCHR